MSGKIAPHENSEVRLVLGGHKPLAVIERKKDPYGWSLAYSLASTGALYLTHYRGDIIITSNKHKDLIDNYVYLIHYGVRDFGIKLYHIKMGKLFGYSREDIDAFIKAEINCECTKCRGVQPCQEERPDT